jgi:hypothetical protein
MPRQRKKQIKKLERRLGGWNGMPKVTENDARGPNAKGTFHHKPGSLKK